MVFLKIIIIIKLSYDLTTPLVNIYPKEMKIRSWRDICIPMLIATYLQSPWYGNKLICDRWIDKKKWGTYGIKGYLAMRKKEILPFVTSWMNLGGILLSQISDTEKEKCHIIFLY